MSTSKIIEKWYKALNFPSDYDREFYAALDEIEISGQWDGDDTDGKKNFLTYLYLCEELSKRYEQKGIPQEILYDTLSDIGIWLNIWSEIKGGLYLGETKWLKTHLDMKLFKLGRLQFNFATASCDIAEKGIKAGDNIIGVHIPEGGPLSVEECEKAFHMARKFFAEYYPEYKYEHFMCHSWLLDKTLGEILKPESNILKFQDMFEIFKAEESPAILKYVFKWNATKENINSFDAVSGFAQKVRDRINDGGKFYVAWGVVNRK